MTPMENYRYFGSFSDAQAPAWEGVPISLPWQARGGGIGWGVREVEFQARRPSFSPFLPGGGRASVS